MFCNALSVVIIFYLNEVIGTKNYEVDCSTLRVGQFICPHPEYDHIDPRTQQPKGCTKENKAKVLCKAADGIICFETNNSTFMRDIPCKWTFQYDTKSTDCHKRNIECFTSFCTSCGLDIEGDIYSAVISLLETTDTSSTEEHKISGLFGNEDQHYFLDIDMVVLGSDPESYVEYSSKIQREYSFLSPVLYKNLRVKVLQNFLQIPNIFATKEFREKYEEQARSNILHEIEQLK